MDGDWLGFGLAGGVPSAAILVAAWRFSKLSTTVEAVCKTIDRIEKQFGDRLEKAESTHSHDREENDARVRGLHKRIDACQAAQKAFCEDRVSSCQGRMQWLINLVKNGGKP